MHTSKQRQRLLTMTLTLALLLTLVPLRVWADEPSGGPDGRPETGQVTAALTQEMGVYLMLNGAVGELLPVKGQEVIVVC